MPTETKRAAEHSLIHIKFIALHQTSATD